MSSMTVEEAILKWYDRVTEFIALEPFEIDAIKEEPEKDALLGKILLQVKNFSRENCVRIIVVSAKLIKEKMDFHNIDLYIEKYIKAPHKKTARLLFSNMKKILNVLLTV